jgi:hypothetical protein
MKPLVLACVLFLSVFAAQAQLPQQQKVWAELQRMYQGRDELLQSWKGPLAKNLAEPEYESMYTFPGTADARIRQRKQSGEAPSLYYQGVIAEGKTANEVNRLFKEWDTMLAACTADKISLKALVHVGEDEQGLFPLSYAMVGANEADATAKFRVQLNYDQDDAGLFTAYIQIGRL